MAVIAIIPARFASTRFPGKPLAKQTGKYLIQHVVEQVGKCAAIDEVIVATDDQRIVDAVKSFGGSVRSTRADHESGTSRVVEVAEALNLSATDILLNVQGDEPEIAPDVLTRLIERVSDATDRVSIATAAAPFDDDGPREGPGSPLDPACVKLVLNAQGRALYFSRSLIPYPQQHEGRVDRPSDWLLHLGVYAFTWGSLAELVAKDQQASGGLEAVESLEQLAWLARGFAIGVEVLDHAFVGIDTPEDYAAFVDRVGSGGGCVSIG